MLLILVIYMYIKWYVQTMRDTTWTDARVETFKADTNWAWYTLKASVTVNGIYIYI